MVFITHAILLAEKPWEADGVVVLETETGTGYCEGEERRVMATMQSSAAKGVCVCLCACCV